MCRALTVEQQAQDPSSDAFCLIQPLQRGPFTVLWSVFERDIPYLSEISIVMRTMSSALQSLLASLLSDLECEITRTAIACLPSEHGLRKICSGKVIC